jgi:hypothetical protein
VSRVLSIRRPSLVWAAAPLALLAALAGAVVAVPTAATAAPPPQHASDVSCLSDSTRTGGPWGHTIVVSGNGKRGARFARTLADNVVPGGSRNGAERDSAWTPASRPLTPAALRQVERRELRAPYFRAVDRRAQQFVRMIRANVAACPEEALILAGYSQGALAVRSALARVARRDDARHLLDHVGGVLLVGDPGARRREAVRRYGVKRQQGQVRGARLPRLLTSRDLVASWCRAHDPMCSATKGSAARGARNHRGYRIDRDGHAAGRQAADYLVAPLVDIELGEPVDQRHPYFVYGDAFTNWPVLNPLTGSASELRLDRDLSMVPAGMSLAEDLTLSGTAPASGDEFTVRVGLRHERFAPATYRYRSVSPQLYPARAGKPGVRLISHALGGVRPDGDSFAVDVSTNGQTVVFVSEATNLVPGDGDGQPNVFVWDRATDQITKVSDGIDASPFTITGRQAPHVSADGRRITWITSVDHPALGDTDGLNDVYFYDRDTGVTQLASPATPVDVTAATLAPDGTRVYFREGGLRLPSRSSDVVRTWDVGEPDTTVLKLPQGGWLPNSAAGEALVLSANGRFALGTTGAEVFSWDLAEHVTVASCAKGVTGSGGGGISNDGTVFAGRWTYQSDLDSYMVDVVCDGGTSDPAVPVEPGAQVSADGRFVTTLRPGAVVTDRSTGALTSVADRKLATPQTYSLSASQDALTVVFDASAFNTVETPPAQRGTREIYLWDRTVSP